MSVQSMVIVGLRSSGHGQQDTFHNSRLSVDNLECHPHTGAKE